MMYFNVNITGSSYVQSSGIIQVSPSGGTPPYLIEYRTFDGTPFPGIKIDDGLYFGFPEYTKAINVPVGFYFVDVTDQYGAGVKLTKCVVVGYSGYNQLNIDNTPIEDTIIFPCETNCQVEPECSKPNFYWILTEDGCYLNLAFNECVNSCWLIGNYCIPADGCLIMDETGIELVDEYGCTFLNEDSCLIMDETGIGLADECGWTFLNEDGNPPF